MVQNPHPQCKYLTGPGMTMRPDGRGVDAQRFVVVPTTLIEMEH